MSESLTARDRLNRLIEISLALMSAREVEDVVGLILESGTELFAAEGCSLALIDHEAEALSFVAMEGAAKTRPFRIPLSQGIAGHVARSGEPVLVNDTEHDPRFLKRVDRDTGFSTRSLLCVPMRRHDQVIGVMNALNCRRVGGFDEEDVRLLMALAGLASAALDRARDEERLRSATMLLREQTDTRYHLVPTRNPRMKEVLRIAKTAARSSSTVLLLGESGTGKEVLARTIHNQSGRREQPFIGVNCVALTPTLLESELFGHEKGAFTGATSHKKGKFELADGGTLFLDEIGDLAPDLQTKLLRALQEREIERVGGEDSIRVDVRVIAATNKDLQTAMRNKEFREDLFYRLNVITLTIPPLRERAEDVAALCTHFLMRACQAVKKPPMQLTEEAATVLTRYAWPGNVRELANVMERIVVLTEGRMVTRTDLPGELLASPAQASTEQRAPRGSMSDQVKAFKRNLVRDALAAAGNNQTRAAELLDVKQSNLSRMMRTLGLR